MVQINRIKAKFRENSGNFVPNDWQKPCHMDIDSFIVQVKTDDVYKNIAEDVEARFDTSIF